MLFLIDLESNGQICIQFFVTHIFYHIPFVIDLRLRLRLGLRLRLRFIFIAFLFFLFPPHTIVVGNLVHGGSWRVVGSLWLVVGGLWLVGFNFFRVVLFFFF